MRLLIVTSTPFDRPEQALYRGLRDAGWTVSLAGAPGAALADEWRSRGLTVTPLAIRHRLDLRAARAIRRLLRERPVDAVYAPTNKALSVTLLAARGLPVRRLAYRGTTGHLHRWDPATWLTYLNPGVDRILCVSEAVRRYLIGFGIAERKLSVVYKGHEPEWYDGPVADRAELGVPADAFLVGFVGNMRPVKGVDTLIRAVERSRSARPVVVALAGEVRDAGLTRLAGRSPARDRIRFLGYRPDAVRLMGAFDAFAMPSVAREGLPRAVIEAMCRAVPPVVSDVGGLPELVVDGMCGRVLPPGEPAAWAAAFDDLAADPERRRALGVNARRRIALHFNARRTLDEVLALLRDEVERGGELGGPCCAPFRVAPFR